ncbi:LSU ribosomal protein L21P [Lutibacter oricola]|uniref:Large ribosomal subunit protein bL21 n=1 Tax=Lutibacter oricola TaxID=762486 RepID=A0A1H2S1L6_9FLAO|nr:50S ribosomal protein L21 [Lutibacter oricola]SDW25478.1 LSU ribosomal protein L21P [Lutibacter oricola]
MYAIVEIAGQQFKVAQDQKVYVHRLQGEEGSKVSFDKVLLLDNEGAVTVGAPAIQGAEVTAKILGHLQGDKVIVFKKKRRKGYKKKNGHRQALTEIQIEAIAATGAKKKAPAKKAAPKKEEAAPVKKAAAKKSASKADDLKKVEGIGPKIAEIFVAAGIDTFAKLAAADVEALKEILAAAGSRYASKNPGSWPKQAKMAAEGKWDELKVWQDNTKGGIE